jgi:hypothetical protein
MMPSAFSTAPRMSGLACVCGLAFLLGGCEPAAEPAQQTASPGNAATDVHEFAGSWNATGTRRTIPLGAERKGSIIDLHGTMLLTGQARPDVGFRADTIALVDSATGLAGRSVWTDEHGDRVFSELNGEGTSSANRVDGKIFGGTGRYAGASGAYSFSWKFVIEAEDGSVQGDAVGLKGSVRFGQTGAGGRQP